METEWYIYGTLHHFSWSRFVSFLSEVPTFWIVISKRLGINSKRTPDTSELLLSVCDCRYSVYCMNNFFGWVRRGWAGCEWVSSFFPSFCHISLSLSLSLSPPLSQLSCMAISSTSHWANPSGSIGNPERPIGQLGECELRLSAGCEIVNVNPRCSVGNPGRPVGRLGENEWRQSAGCVIDWLCFLDPLV